MEIEDSQADKILLKFSVSIESNFRYFEIEIYLELCIDFLPDKINTEDFCSYFRELYITGNIKPNKIKKGPVELLNWLKPTNSTMDSLLCKGCALCTSFIMDPEGTSTEVEMRKYARTLVIAIQLNKELKKHLNEGVFLRILIGGSET